MTNARDAGLGWLAPDAWGVETTADPASLAPLMQAIDRAAPGLKIALFDDTTSAVLRKNRARGHGWTLDVRFDLSDLAGTGEGGLEYFYDQQWKRFFQTVPPAYRLTIDGRPVVFMWHGGFEWYTRQNFFHGLIDALRQATRRDFGVDPFVIVEESWLRLDPAAGVDGVFDWFEPGRSFATLMTRNGIRVGHVVPGYDCSRCAPAGPVILRQAGKLYQAALEAVAPSSDLVLIEGITNVDENAHLLDTSAWGRLYWASPNGSHRTSPDAQVLLAVLLALTACADAPRRSRRQPRHLRRGTCGTVSSARHGAAAVCHPGRCRRRSADDER